MRKPVVAAMSGVSVAVLGLSLHASQRTSAVAAGAALAGLVESSGAATTDTAPTAPTLADPTSTSANLPGQSAPHSPPPNTTRTATTTQPPIVRPSTTSDARSSPPTTSKTAPSPAPRPTAKPVAPTVVVNGSPVDTRYGPVQVQITLRGGHITKADAIDYPQSNGRDQEINSQAIPQLDQETVRADGAQIDAVSGATYTSGGYRQSLQSALDAAHKAGAR